MGKALDADLAGVGGIDDVEDMLDDESVLQLSRREVFVPATFVILDIGQQHPDDCLVTVLRWIRVGKCREVFVRK